MTPCPECGDKCHNQKNTIKILEDGISLIHEILTDCDIPEEIRIRLADWRDEASEFLP